MNATSKKPAPAPVVQMVTQPSAGAATITCAELATLLEGMFPERASQIRAILVAVLAGEHVVMLGPPGTAKSALFRQLVAAFGASYFEKLMNGFTTPDEVFGPPKLSALQADKFSRATAGYLPTCEMVFLTEVFKANSAILNALLTVMNERVFHDDGKPVPVPLLSMVADSNELPEGPELDALYDRFLFRLCTDYISDRDAFRRMLTAPAMNMTARVAIRAEMAQARAVVVTDETIEALVTLRYSCRDAGIIVSDRRWRQCVGAVRAAAHLDGRTTTEPEDLEILEHILWRKPDERVAISRRIQTVVNPAGAEAVKQLDAAREVFAKIPAKGSIGAGAYMSALGDACNDLQEIQAKLEALPVSRKVAAAKTEVAHLVGEAGKLAMRAAGMKL